MRCILFIFYVSLISLLSCTTGERTNPFDPGSNNYKSPSIYISSHPSDLTVNEGQLARFSISANCTEPLSYQWYKDDVIISGATSSSYSISSTALYNCGIYSCKVGNFSTSNECNDAVLTVNANHNKSVILEDFTNVTSGVTTSGWPSYDLSYVKTRINSGFYYMDYDSTGMMFRSTNSFYSFDSSGSYSVEISAEHISNSDGDPFGLIFYGSSSGDFYRFAISDGKYFTIDRNYNDEWTTLVSWTHKSFINATSKNILKITKSGFYTYFYINGIWVKTLYISNIYGNWFGFTVSEIMEVKFDYIKITK